MSAIVTAPTALENVDDGDSVCCLLLLFVCLSVCLFLRSGRQSGYIGAFREGGGERGGRSMAVAIVHSD